MDLEVPLALVISTDRRRRDPRGRVPRPRPGPGGGRLRNVTSVTPRSPPGGHARRVGIEVVLSDQCDLKSSTWARTGAWPSSPPRQHGVVSMRQVREIGLSEGSIRHRLRSGRLHPVMRGVYAVGHDRLSLQGRWMAAVLTHRPWAVLSHRSAGALLGILATARERIEITVPGPASGPARDPATLRRARALTTSSSHRGIPVTARRPGRSWTSPGSWARAGCGVRSSRPRSSACWTWTRSGSPPEAAAAPGRSFACSTMERLAHGSTRSELEQRFLDFLRRLGSATARDQCLAPHCRSGREVDCLWRGRRSSSSSMDTRPTALATSSRRTASATGRSPPPD